MPPAGAGSAPSDPATDEELATRVRDGDREAFGELLHRHEDRVYNLARRIVGRSETARDIAQDVFLAFWQDPHSYRPAARFTTWLYRVTSNRSISHLRSSAIKKLFTFSDYDPGEIAVADEEGADNRLIQSETALTLEREIARLPARQRAVIHLRYTEGLSVAEAATALGISVRSAESLLYRAKETLRDRLGSG